MDARHQKRIKVIQDLYAASFPGSKIVDDESKELLEKIDSKRKEIDELVGKYATRYPLDKVSKIDLSILRLAIYELMFDRQNPPKVVIDEAVTLAREFGTEKSYAFINGVLGSIMRSTKQNEK